MAPTSADLIRRNEAYAESHQPLPYIAEIESMGAPPPKTCIVTCVDPRLSIEPYLGLVAGEAFIFRTIAAHPQSVFQQILALDAVSQGWEDLLIINHTDCGAELFDDVAILGELSSLNRGGEIEHIEFGTITAVIDQAVKNDVEFLKEQLLMRKGLAERTKGYVLDIKTGKLNEVV